MSTTENYLTPADEEDEDTDSGAKNDNTEDSATTNKGEKHFKTNE